MYTKQIAIRKQLEQFLAGRGAPSQEYRMGMQVVQTRHLGLEVWVVWVPMFASIVASYMSKEAAELYIRKYGRILD